MVQANRREHPSLKKTRNEDEILTENEELVTEKDDGRKRWEKWIGEGEVEEPPSSEHGLATRAPHTDSLRASNLRQGEVDLLMDGGDIN